MQGIDTQIISSQETTSQFTQRVNVPTLFSLPFPTIPEPDQSIARWKSIKIKLAVIFFPIGLMWLAWRITAIVIFKCANFLIRRGLFILFNDHLFHLPRHHNPELSEIFARPHDRYPDIYIQSLSGINHVGAELAIIPSSTFFNKNITLKPFHTDRQFVNPEIDPMYRMRAIFMVNPNNHCTPITLQFPNQPKLDAMISWANKEEQTYYDNHGQTMRADSEWIVMYQPNGACYESTLLEDMDFKVYNSCGINILFFNYSGVMDSEGYPQCARDLITDGHAPVEYLKSRNVPSNRIVLYGFSLGGSVAAHVAAEQPGVHHVNMHSFSSLSKVIHGQIYSKEGIDTTSIRTTLLSPIKMAAANVVEWLVAGILEEHNWQMDTTTVWDKITGHKWIITAENDEVVKGVGRLAFQVNIAAEQNIIHLNAKHAAPLGLGVDRFSWEHHFKQLDIAFDGDLN